MTTTWRMLSGAAAVALGLGLASAAWAGQTTRAEQDPAVPGNLNKCWGQIASQTAKLDTPDGTNGGAFGQHSRSTQAANINGGFAAGDAGIRFNEDGGRQGVGNVSADVEQRHNTSPGDGGNGVHAINNAAATAAINPVTGDRVTSPEDVVELSCVP
jgi:hypothetical protein